MLLNCAPVPRWPAAKRGPRARRPVRLASRPHGALLLASALIAWGCDGGGAGRVSNGSPRPLALAVSAGADTAALAHLVAPAPARARAWLARVSIARAAPVAVPPPAPAPDTLLPEVPPAPTLLADPGLLPPVLLDPAPLVLPSPVPGARAAWVELEVRVSETGTVTDVVAAGGSAGPAHVAAASACARAMRFYPAQQRGAPVAVWCRQRFDFGAR